MSTFHGGVVLYAKDLARVAAFYQLVTGLPVRETAGGHVRMEANGFQLVVLQIPPAIASGIVIATPPVPREETPVKPVFPVADVGAARSLATQLGGTLNGPEKEWSFDGLVVCDGVDPEGNVFQLRSAPPPK